MTSIMAALFGQSKTSKADSPTRAARSQDQDKLEVIVDDKTSAMNAKSATTNDKTSTTVAEPETTEEKILKQLQEDGRKMDMMAMQIKGLEKALEGQAAINKKLQKNFDDAEKEELERK